MFLFRILILILGVLVNVNVNAMSVNELRTNSDRYWIEKQDNEADIYLDVNSIGVIRYNPPYYSIRFTEYMIFYSYPRIVTQGTVIYHYNWNTKEVRVSSSNEAAYSWGGSTLWQGNKFNEDEYIKSYSKERRVVDFVFRKAYNMNFYDSTGR